LPKTKFYFKNPQLIKNKINKINILNKITDHAITLELDQTLPNTQSHIIGVYSMVVKLFNSSYLIGNSIILPDYILKSKYIVTRNTVENNLCFWACCSLMYGCKKIFLLQK